MLTYFLVKGIVTTYPYMGEPYKHDDIRLVKAANSDGAFIAYLAYWENQSDEYSVRYSVDVQVMETVE